MAITNFNNDVNFNGKTTVPVSGFVPSNSDATTPFLNIGDNEISNNSLGFPTKYGGILNNSESVGIGFYNDSANSIVTGTTGTTIESMSSGYNNVLQGSDGSLFFSKFTVSDNSMDAMCSTATVADGTVSQISSGINLTPNGILLQAFDGSANKSTSLTITENLIIVTGKIELDGGNISTDGSGNITAVSYLGNGNNLTVTDPTTNSSSMISTALANIYTKENNYLPLDGGTISGQLSIAKGLYLGSSSGSSYGIEIGDTTSGTSNSAYIDFHSSGSNNDYDSRILSYGGTSGTNGQSTLNIYTDNFSVISSSSTNLISASSSNIILTSTLVEAKANFSVTGTSSLDNGKITTDGNGNITSVSYLGDVSGAQVSFANGTTTTKQTVAQSIKILTSSTTAALNGVAAIGNQTANLSADGNSFGGDIVTTSGSTTTRQFSASGGLSWSSAKTKFTLNDSFSYGAADGTYSFYMSNGAFGAISGSHRFTVGGTGGADNGVALMSQAAIVSVKNSNIFMSCATFSVSSSAATPASTTDAGTTDEIRFDDTNGIIYRCTKGGTAGNATWKKFYATTDEPLTAGTSGSVDLSVNSLSVNDISILSEKDPNNNKAGILKYKDSNHVDIFGGKIGSSGNLDFSDGNNRSFYIWPTNPTGQFIFGFTTSSDCVDSVVITKSSTNFNNSIMVTGTSSLDNGKITTDGNGNITTNGITASNMIIPNSTYSNLTSSPTIGMMILVTDALKPGEVTGSGTGCLCVYDGSNWVNISTGTTVST